MISTTSKFRYTIYYNALPGCPAAPPTEETAETAELQLAVLSPPNRLPSATWPPTCSPSRLPNRLPSATCRFELLPLPSKPPSKRNLASNLPSKPHSKCNLAPLGSMLGALATLIIKLPPARELDFRVFALLPVKTLLKPSKCLQKIS